MHTIYGAPVHKLSYFAEVSTTSNDEAAEVKWRRTRGTKELVEQK